MPHSIQAKLASALAPVIAPEELWSRIDAGLHHAAPRRARFPLWPRLLMAAILAALMSGGVLYLRAQQTSYALSPFTAAAVRLHQAQPSPDASYAVQRYTLNREPVTVVSTPHPSPSSALSKTVRTMSFNGLAVSEWTSRGRRWAMISANSAHKQACSICHRA